MLGGNLNSILIPEPCWEPIKFHTTFLFSSILDFSQFHFSISIEYFFLAPGRMKERDTYILFLILQVFIMFYTAGGEYDQISCLETCICSH